MLTVQLVIQQYSLDAMKTARIAIVYMLNTTLKPGDCPLLADALPRRSDQVRQGEWPGVGWWRDRTLLRCLNPNSWWTVRYLKTNSIYWHGEVTVLSQQLKGICPLSQPVSRSGGLIVACQEYVHKRI